jgi:pimeloyl-ACP methyl ester carboxylesterase
VTATSFRSGPRVETTDGVGIATYDLGGDGPPLILAHATGFHGLVWLPLAAALRDRYHCWAFDSRGHGASEAAPEGNYDWDGFALDALAVTRAVAPGAGDERPRAVGHSCGGAALLLAEEAEPGTFAALYCYEPVVPIIGEGAGAGEGGGAAGGGEAGGGAAGEGGGEAPTGNPLAAGARRRREVFESRAAALDNYAAKAPFTSFDPAALEAYVEWGFRDLPDGRVQLACRREDEARVYEQAWRHHAYQHLDRVACPVALASGGRHAHFGLEVITAIAARLRHGASTPIEVHEDLGHFGPMERPAEVAASIVRAFDAMGVA